MGGPKKKSLAQMEKQKRIQDVKKQKAITKASKGKNTKSSGIGLQEVSEEDLKNLAGIKALTPFVVATKYNVRLSVARNILEILEENKTIQQVANGGKGLKIYKFV